MIWSCKILLQNPNLCQLFYTLSRTRAVGWDKVNCEGKIEGRATENNVVKKMDGKKKSNRDKEVWENGMKEWNGGVGVWLGKKKKRWKKTERRWKDRRFSVWWCSYPAGCTLKHTLNDISVSLLIGLGGECLVLPFYFLIWIGRRILLRLRPLL